MEAPLFCHDGDDGGVGGGQTNNVSSRYVVEVPSASTGSDLILQPWKLRRCVVDNGPTNGSTPAKDVLELTPELKLLHSKGCASVTTIQTPSSDSSSLTVTTTSLPYHPSTVALSVLVADSDGHTTTSKPYVFELDLSKCSISTTNRGGGSTSIRNCFGPVVVKSRVFFVPKNSCLIWHLVDNRANVLTVRLNLVVQATKHINKKKQGSSLSLEPIASSSVTFHSIWMSVHHDPTTTNDVEDTVIDVQLSKVSRDGLRQLRQCHGMKSSKTVYEQGLPSGGGGGYQGGDSYYFPRLPSSHVVEFIDSDTLLLALPSTYLICYHLPTETIYPWMTLRSTYQTTSQRRALGVGDSEADGRKSRRSTIGEFFGGFFGGTGDDDDDDDEEEGNDDARNRLASAKKKKKTAIVPDYEQEWRTAAADEKRRGRRMDPGEEASGPVNDDDDDEDDDNELYDDAVGMDQPSGVAAISVLSPGNYEENSKIVMQTVVFTLHADGTVRKWTCKPSKTLRALNMEEDEDENANTTAEPPHKHCLPLDVHVLRTMMTIMTTETSPTPTPSPSFWLCRRGPPFPSSREWSTSCDALWLDSQYINDGLQYALALCVQTRFPTNDYYSLLDTLGYGDADASYNNHNNNTIMSMLLHGPTHFTEYGYIPGVSHLNRLKETSVGRLLPLPFQRDHTAIGTATTITGLTSLVILPEEEQPNNREDEDTVTATVDANLNKFFVRCSVHALYETETDLTTVTNVDSEDNHGSDEGETNVIHNDDDTIRRGEEEEDDDDVLMGNTSVLVVRNHNSTEPDTPSALATGALLVQYHPLTTTASSPSAAIAVHPLSLEQYAMMEWNSLQQTATATLCLTSLQEVDAFYLKQLFRSPWSTPNALRRGGGGGPPNHDVVLRALLNICPTLRNSTSSGGSSSSSTSLEAKVLMAIRAWTRSSSSSSSSSSSNTAMVVRRSQEEEKEDVGAGDRSATTAQHPQEQYLLKQHCYHWKCLLEAVWLEEMDLRRPLLLSERNTTNDLVLVRSGVTTRYGDSGIGSNDTSHNNDNGRRKMMIAARNTTNPIIPVLDGACLTLYQQCSSSKKPLGSYMATIQQRLFHMIESCHFLYSSSSSETTTMTNRSPPTLKDVFAYNTTAIGEEEDVVNGFDTVMVPLLIGHIKGWNDIMEALTTMTAKDLVEWIQWKGDDYISDDDVTIGIKMQSTGTFSSLVYECQCLLMTYQHKLVVKCLLLNCMMQRHQGLTTNERTLIQTVALKRLLEVTALQYVLNQPIPNHQNTTTTTVLEEQLTYMVQQEDTKNSASLHTVVLQEFVTRYIMPSHSGRGGGNLSAAVTAAPQLPQPPLESLQALGYRLMMRLLTPTLVYHTASSTTSIEDEETDTDDNSTSFSSVSNVVNKQEQFKTMALCLFHEASFIGKYYGNDNDDVIATSSIKKLRDLGMYYLQQSECYTLLHQVMMMMISLRYQEGGGDIVMDTVDDDETPSSNSTNDETVASVWKRLIYLKGSFMTNNNDNNDDEEEDVVVVAAANDKLHKLLMDFMWSSTTTGVFAETDDADDQKVHMIQTTVNRLVSVHSFASLVRPMMNNNSNTAATISSLEELLHAASIHGNDFLLYLKWVDTLALRLKAISIVEEHVGASDGYLVILQTCQHAMNHLEPVLLSVLEQLKQDDVVGRESMVNVEDTTMEFDDNAMDDPATILSDQTKLYMNNVATTVEYVNLWSAIFRNAMLGHDFIVAHKACDCNPLRERRLENCRRLIKGMMECGQLTQFITTFSVKPDHEQLTVPELLGVDGDDHYSKQNERDAFFLTAKDKWKLIDYYDITTEVLKETAYEYLKGNHFDKANEYVMALYSLYVKRFEWRLAATSSNHYVEELVKQIIVTSASSSLFKSNYSLMQKLLEYMIHANCMASNALHLVDDSRMNQFLIVTNKETNMTKLIRPNDLERRTEVLKGLLCLWKHDQRLRKTNSEQQPLQLLEVENIVEALKLLYHDKTGCIQDPLNVADDVNDTPPFNNQGYQCLLWTSEQLASRRYYKDAVSLTLLLSHRSCPDVSTEVSAKALVRGVCDYLVPIVALDKTSNNKRHFPTEAQLLSQISNPKCDVVVNSSNKNRQVLAMMILKDLVGEHANHCNGLAVEVARTWLHLTDGMKQVPVWLVELLLYGKYHNKSTSSGLFATSPAEAAASLSSTTAVKDDSDTSNTQARARHDDCKHPQALIRLYMEHGLLHEATDVVVEVLSLSSRQTPQEEETATTILPEKGYIEYVPYRTIDWLYEMLRKTNDVSNMKRMEVVLKEHFERLQTIEQGLLSTRRQLQQ